MTEEAGTITDKTAKELVEAIKMLTAQISQSNAHRTTGATTSYWYGRCNNSPFQHHIRQSDGRCSCGGY